ncbi:ROK family transcriptional regulator [Gracilibacillus dipsosauri]|uniref:Transcriptional regulator n=1 Tax=Gracilibacillus dipsosauri TaxID=178340 RepID=A0A317L1D1_9BACI|nr:ROK family transcriptional regulator [Gracilibacillus dipsosauri]PWU69363.1 transcriptional regulator [Gracilibacillus dipsosauri]
MKRTGDLKLIQELNRSIVLDTIRRYGPISRSEIAKKNELSPTTVTSAVQDLIRERLVNENGTGLSSGGRKPILLQFSPDNHYLIGVSISYSKITIADMNLEAKINQKNVYLTNGYTNEHLIEYLLELLHGFLTERKDNRICVGISIITQGIVDAYQGIIHHNPKLQLNNVYLKNIVENRLELPTWLDNDTNAYVLAEKNFGLYQEYKNMVYITIGDGLGAGIIVNDSLARGVKGGSGEFGHTTININGKPCECGNKGCLENYVSWPSIHERLITAIKNGKNTLLTDLSNGKNESILPEHFTQAINAGDELANEVLNEVSFYLAAGLVNLVHLFNPDIIILGGEITNNNKLLFNRLSHLVEDRSLKTLYKDVNIKIASLGEEFEMIGAASVLLQDKFQFKLTHDEIRLNRST